MVEDIKYQMFSHQEILFGSAHHCHYNKFVSNQQQVYASINYNIGVQKAYIKDLKTDFGTLVSKKNMKIKLIKHKNQ